MSESEFLELLNLYLDHEISAADAIRLEDEIRRNPERRKIYREYCRMQQACRVLASSVTEENESLGARTKGVPIAERGNARERRLTYYFAGSAVAAAACLAFVFVVVRDRMAEPNSASSGEAMGAPIKVEAAPATLVSSGGHPDAGNQRSGLVAVRDRQTEASAMRVSLMSESLVLSSNSHVPPLETLATLPAAEMDQLAWMRNFQLASVRQPVEVELLRFGTVPANLRPEARRLGARGETEAEVEMTSFRFVK